MILERYKDILLCCKTEIPNFIDDSTSNFSVSDALLVLLFRQKSRSLRPHDVKYYSDKDEKTYRPIASPSFRGKLQQDIFVPPIYLIIISQ